MFETTYFARTNYRTSRQIFGIKLGDRFYHFYTLGKSGAGKTTLLKTLALQDIDNGHALCFFDPHGDAVQELYSRIAPHRLHKVIYFDLTNPNIEWGYNPIRNVPPTKRSLVASSILDVFKRLWKSAWGMKMEHILRMVLLTLLDQAKADFTDINRLLLDSHYRTQCLKSVQNEDVRLFWEREFPKYKSNDLLPLLSKTGAFLAHPINRRVLVENKRQISLRMVMDTNRVLLINLAKGSVGSDVAHTIGSLLLTSLASASFSRIDTDERDRKPFFMYIDEFQTLTNEELVSEMLSELRKFRVGLILSNQFLHQLDGDVKNAVLGNVGTLVSFRLGISDAKLMAQEFYPVFKAEDFISLKNASIYLKMMIDGKPTRPFSADTIL